MHELVAEGALDALPHPVFVVDGLRPGRPNVYVNAAYSARTGYGAHEAVGAGFDALAIFTDAASVAALDGRPDAATGVHVRRRDGTTFPAQLHVRALARADGGRYIVGWLEEVEPRAHASERAPKSPLDAALAGGSANDAFLSWLAHELRSPLNTCSMWLDVLALAPQPDKLTKAVEAMKRGLARQARLVSDLSDAAKVSSGRMELRRESLDLVTLLKRGLDVWQPLAAGKQLAFGHRLELEAAPIDGDPERLTQALNHLLENAISSTPTGGRVDVRLRGADASCIVEVEDTGGALSTEDAANLATPLWRSPTSAKARSGLGLGLAVAHHVAVEHGGMLAAESAVSGARLVLTLPLAASRREPAARAGTDR